MKEKVYWMIEQKGENVTQCLGVKRRTFILVSLTSDCALRFTMKEDADRFLSENLESDSYYHVKEHLFIS